MRVPESRQRGIESFLSKSKRTVGNGGSDKATSELRPANLASVSSFFLPQSAGKCISEGLISKIFWGACPQTPLEAHALRAFAYMAYGHVIHVTVDI